MTYIQLTIASSDIPGADRLEGVIFLGEPEDPAAIVLEQRGNPGEPAGRRRLFLCEQTAEELIRAIHELTGSPVPEYLQA